MTCLLFHVVHQSEVDECVSLTTRLEEYEYATSIIAAKWTPYAKESSSGYHEIRGVGVIHRFAAVDAQAQMVENVKNESSSFVVGAAVGTDHDAVIRSKALIASGVDLLVLDIAHGHAEHSITALKELKDAFPETDVVVGNIATEAGAGRSLRGWSGCYKSWCWTRRRLHDETSCRSRRTPINSYFSLLVMFQFQL